jgi:Zn-dependent protease/CBS domain-containing protein
MNGIRLGRILGLEIRIDYSWFVIAFLILWTFTVGVFPLNYPGLAAGAYVVMGVVGTLLFFISILVHEISHSLVARRRGIPVEGITLFIFGGIARSSAEFEDPGDEFVIAGVGPLTSFFLAGLLAAIAWLGVRLGWTAAVTGVAAQLAAINFILAVFNLLPGFPLDGGRLFRAAVWKRTGDLRKATRWATNGGKLLGFALIALGILQLFAGNPIGGLWLILIGWFVRAAAEASMLQLLAQHSLKGVRTADIMSRNPITVPPDLALQEFVDRFVLEGRHRAYPVAEDDHALGLITVRQLQKIPREEWSRRTVAEVMVPVEKGITVNSDAPMTDVTPKLTEATGGRVLVLSNGKLEGIITRSDLARWLERIQLVDRDE